MNREKDMASREFAPSTCRGDECSLATENAALREALKETLALAEMAYPHGGDFAVRARAVLGLQHAARLPPPKIKEPPMTQELADQIAAKYKDVPFDALRAETVGGIRRENVDSARFSANMLLRQYEGASCDSDGSSTCIRCNTVFLAKMALEALDGVKTVAELARERAERAQ